METKTEPRWEFDDAGSEAEFKGAQFYQGWNTTRGNETPKGVREFCAYVDALETQLAAANARADEATNMLELAQSAATSWQETAIATEQREEQQKVRRREAKAELEEARRVISDCAADYEMWGSAEEKGKELDALRATVTELVTCEHPKEHVTRVDEWSVWCSHCGSFALEETSIDNPDAEPRWSQPNLIEALAAARSVQ